MEWPLDGVRRVSVNCFGFGGTNAHVIMDEAPRYLSARGLKGNHNSLVTSPANASTFEYNPDDYAVYQVFCFSSHEKSGLRRVIESHLSYLNSQQRTDPNFLRNYAYTLGSRRSNLEWRYHTTTYSRKELINQLQNVRETSFERSSKIKKLKICFLFCGQGAQFAQMGKNLMPFEVFRESLKAASSYMKETLGSPFDLLEEILREERDSRISHPQIAQPATTALQIALVDLLESFHITPNCVLGHSSGEVAAAYASGALSKETAWKVAYHRGVVASSIGHKAPQQLQGAMMVVSQSVHNVETHLSTSSCQCEVACINSPRSTTLSGPKNCIMRAKDEFSAKNVFCRILPVTVAYHSSHMRLVENEYKSALELVTPREHLRGVRMFSSVTGAPVKGSDLDKHYWIKNLVSPVNFLDAMESVMKLPEEECPNVVLELSPGAALRYPVEEIRTSIGDRARSMYIPVLKGRNYDEAQTLLDAIGQLWTLGYSINMDKVIPREFDQVPLKCLSDLPPYPWNHTKSYWHESHLGRANRFREFPRQDLIGAPTADSISFEPRWRGFLRISENPWIQDHRVQKTIIYPAAGMVTMALEGIRQRLKGNERLLGYEITNMRIDKAMIIPSTAHGLETALNFKLTSPVAEHQKSSPCFEFSIYSKQLDAPWEHHATGLIQAQFQGEWMATFGHHQKKYESIKAACRKSIVPRQLYELLDNVGMNYGTLFQNITEIRNGDHGCVSEVRVPDTKSKMPAKFEYDHLIHPATLDSMFQTLFAIENEPMVPTYIKSIFVSSDISRDRGNTFTGYAAAKRSGIRDANADIAMAQSCWTRPSVVINGLRLTKISSPPPVQGGFIPNNHTLCTHILWKKDITMEKDINSVEYFIRGVAYKYPDFSILQVGGSMDMTMRIADICATAGQLEFVDSEGEDWNFMFDREKPWLSRFSLARISENDDLLLSLALPCKRLWKGPLEERSIHGPMPKYNLIIVCNRKGVDVFSPFKHLKQPGFLLEVCGEATTGPNEGDMLSFQPSLVDNIGDLKFRLHRHDPTFKPDTTTNVIVLLPEEPQPEATWFPLRFGAICPWWEIQPMHLSGVLEDPARVKGKVVISLLDFTLGKAKDASVFHWKEADFKAFHSLQTNAKGILWITRGATIWSWNPKGAPIIGLSRTLVSEDPLKIIVTFDLDIETSLNSEQIIIYIYHIFDRSFNTDQGPFPRELEYAERGGFIYVPRLSPNHPINDIIENGVSTQVLDVPFHSKEHPLKLHIERPGLDDDNMKFVPGDRFNTEPSGVTIIFESATLNHTDLETAMGRTVDSVVGADIRGFIDRMSRNVSGLLPGNHVSALVVDGSFQNTMQIDSRFVREWPYDLPMSQCVSAYHSLVKVGRLGRGKTVLVHTGASPFGLAAIAVASPLSIEVFATIKTPDLDLQRALLNKVGVHDDHIILADSDDFVKVVCDLTGGNGVDLVYNSTQDHVQANFKCVRRGKFTTPISQYTYANSY